MHINRIYIDAGPAPGLFSKEDRRFAGGSNYFPDRIRDSYSEFSIYSFITSYESYDFPESSVLISS